MSRIQAPAAVETHSIPPFSATILKYLSSAVSPRSNPAKAAFTTGIRRTAFGACSPPCSTRRCRKRSSKSRSFCALATSRFGMSPPNAAYAVRRTAVFRPSPQTILLRSSVQRKSKPFFKRSNGTKAFSQISFRRNRKIRLHRHGAAFNKPRKRIIFTRKTCCRMGQSNPRRPCDLRIGVNVRNFACILKVYPKFSLLEKIPC